MKSAKLLKSATKKRDPKKHLSLAIRDRKHANRIPRSEVGASLVVYANVKVTTKRFDYYGVIMNRERSALPNEFKLGEDNSDQIKVHPELNCVSSRRPCVCMLATEPFSKNFSREHANASLKCHMLSCSVSRFKTQLRSSEAP